MLQCLLDIVGRFLLDSELLTSLSSCEPLICLQDFVYSASAAIRSDNWQKIEVAEFEFNLTVPMEIQHDHGCTSWAIVHYIIQKRSAESAFYGILRLEIDHVLLSSTLLWSYLTGCNCSHFMQKKKKKKLI